MGSRNWTRDETLLALRLYCHEAFGRLHQSNPAVVELARALGRTPSAVAMKACNLAGLDEAIGQKGLGNCSRLDRQVWDEFLADSEAIAAEIEAITAERSIEAAAADAEGAAGCAGPTESTALVRIRRVQGFFRRALLASYGGRCALSDVTEPEFLIASHIIPWNEAPARRADPRNGILLNCYYDRAFDRGFITFDEDRRLVVSERLRKGASEFHQINMLAREGEPLRLPERFHPDSDALAWHRRHLFAG